MNNNYINSVNEIIEKIAINYYDTTELEYGIFLDTGSDIIKEISDNIINSCLYEDLSHHMRLESWIDYMGHRINFYFLCYKYFYDKEIDITYYLDGKEMKNIDELVMKLSEMEILV